MTPCFGDTFFFLALLVEGDEAHQRAVQAISGLKRDLYTTTWVLTEVADGIAARDTRGTFTPFLRFLRNHPKVTIVPGCMAVIAAGFSRPVFATAFRRWGAEHSLSSSCCSRPAGFSRLADAAPPRPCKYGDAPIVPATDDLFDQRVDLYGSRPDKDWSLTDCISFVVMRERGMREALTGDHHFEQAGFVALLK